MLIQNYIRYGHHASYSPGPAMTLLMIGFFLILLFLPFYLAIVSFIKTQHYRNYWLLIAGLSIFTILLFFTFSSALVHVFGFYDTFWGEKYARYYFGRLVFFHILLLGGISAYVFYKKEVRIARLISGTIGRKKVTLQANLAKWIEADDHYLKIHFKEGTMITRATLEQMAKDLQPDFIRIHRKYLVNKSQVIGKEKEKREEYLILSTGERLKVGRSFSPIDL